MKTRQEQTKTKVNREERERERERETETETETGGDRDRERERGYYSLGNEFLDSFKCERVYIVRYGWISLKKNRDVRLKKNVDKAWSVPHLLPSTYGLPGLFN